MNIKTEIKEYGFPVTHNCVRSETRITELEARLAAAQAEITRLRAGGCTREQGTSQYCDTAQQLTEALTAAIDVIERYARLESASWGSSLKEQNEHARGATEHFRAAISGEGDQQVGMLEIADDVVAEREREGEK